MFAKPIWKHKIAGTQNYGSRDIFAEPRSVSTGYAP